MLKRFTSSRTAIRLSIWLAHHFSAEQAGRLARTFARALILGRGEMYRALRSNQARVRGLPLDDPTLDAALTAVINHAGQVYYDLFRHADPDEPFPVRLTTITQEVVEDITSGRRGTILISAHLSNFDLGIRYVTSHYTMPVQLLSLAEPPAGFQLMNAMRANPLCEVTPVSPTALRQAMRRLSQGGVVGTGVDRPVPGDLESLTFFGAPAALPTGHIRLALQTDAQIVVMWCEWSPALGYVIHTTPPLLIDRGPASREERVRHNAQRVLRLIEAAIARRPEQWMMFIPVWQ